MLSRSLVFVSALMTLILSISATGAERGQWRAGLLAGDVTLSGDVSNDDPSSVGYGITGGYYVDENLAIEASYLASSHTSVNHSELAFGGNYYFGDYIYGYPHFDAGANLITNKLKAAKVNGDAMAFYLGAGFDFEVSEPFTVGLDARYNFAFEGKTQVNGQDITTVDNNLTVLLRFLYRFASAE